MSSLLSPPPFYSAFSSLVWPYQPKTFMKDFWLKKPFFQEGSEERLKSILEIIP